MERIAQRHESGRATAFAENPVALADAAQRLADMSLTELQAIGGRSRQFYKERLCLGVGAGRLGEFFKVLASHTALAP